MASWLMPCARCGNTTRVMSEPQEGDEPIYCPACARLQEQEATTEQGIGDTPAEAEAKAKVEAAESTTPGRTSVTSSTTVAPVNPNNPAGTAPSSAPPREAADSAAPFKQADAHRSGPDPEALALTHPTDRSVEPPVVHVESPDPRNEGGGPSRRRR